MKFTTLGRSICTYSMNLSLKYSTVVYSASHLYIIILKKMCMVQPVFPSAVHVFYNFL